MRHSAGATPPHDSWTPHGHGPEGPAHGGTPHGGTPHGGPSYGAMPHGGLAHDGAQHSRPQPSGQQQGGPRHSAPQPSGPQHGGPPTLPLRPTPATGPVPGVDGPAAPPGLVPPFPGPVPLPPGPGHAPPPHPGGRTLPPDGTGHVALPPDAPVAAPSVVPGPQAGTGATILAVLLIGPAGAGKTTVARYWAARRPVPTAHISLDDVREWVHAGFADPQAGWNDNSEVQYRLARRTCGFAARNFLANGISCVIDDAVFPDRPVVGLGGWKRHVGPGLLPVVLLPGLDVVLERNAERTGNRRLSDEEVASIHGRMAGWYGSGLPIIDNSQLDVPATAQRLDEVLARAIASPPPW